MNDTIAEMIDAADDTDPYDALCLMFDICHALYWLDPNTIPASWEFRPGLMSVDYVDCAANADGECTAHSSGECAGPRDLLTDAGVTDFADPYGTDAGRHAERALIDLGNALNPVSNRYDG